MKAWNNASIRAKVTLAFCVVLLAVATLSALSINRMAAIDEAAGPIRDNYLPSTAMSGKSRPR